MGGLVGGLMDGIFGSAASAPPPPDYMALAKQTADANQKAAELATQANRYNSTNASGSANWTQDPLTGKWTQSSTLSAPNQGLFGQAQGNLGTALNKNLTYSAGDPNLLQQNVTDALYNQQTKYLDPQFQQSQQALESQLANQGITRGSEAYNNAMLNASNAKEQAYSGARNSAIGQGVSAAQGMFGMNLSNANLNNSATNQGITQNFNAMNGIQGLAPTPNNYNQGAVAGADYLGAGSNLYNAQVGNVNAQNAARDNMIGGVMALAGKAMPTPKAGG